MKVAEKDRLRRQYSTLLKSYILTREEGHLLAAADLGREFLQTEIKIEEIAEIHHEATLDLVQEFPDLSLSRVSRHISIPLMECLMAYGLAIRRQEQERRTMQEAQLLQSRKLETLGILASGVVHEMNNILAGITGLASLLEDSLDPGDSRLQDVQDILAACDKGHSLTRGLLGFSRKSRPHREPLSINQQVLEAVRILRGTIPKSVRIETHLKQDLPPTSGDPSQIALVLMNLALNAIDAMDGEGIIRFATDNTVVTTCAPSSLARLEPGPYVRLQVTDTGKGMDARTRQQAFEPFFSTKPKGRGTGLGLAIVYDTIESHRGTITLDSAPGGGTTVTIYLPATASRECR